MIRQDIPSTNAPLITPPDDPIKHLEHAGEHTHDLFQALAATCVQLWRSSRLGPPQVSSRSGVGRRMPDGWSNRLLTRCGMGRLVHQAARAAVGDLANPESPRATEKTDAVTGPGAPCRRIEMSAKSEPRDQLAAKWLPPAGGWPNTSFVGMVRRTEAGPAETTSRSLLPGDRGRGGGQLGGFMQDRCAPCLLPNMGFTGRTRLTLSVVVGSSGATDATPPEQCNGCLCGCQCASITGPQSSFQRHPHTHEPYKQRCAGVPTSASKLH